MTRRSLFPVLLLVFTSSAIFSKERTLSASDIGKIESVCHRLIGTSFEDPTLLLQLAPFTQVQSDLLRPTTVCDDSYCTGSLRLFDSAEVFYTFLPKQGNRYVGVRLQRLGKVLFLEGHVDPKTGKKQAHRD